MLPAVPSRYTSFVFGNCFPVCRFHRACWTAEYSAQFREQGRSVLKFQMIKKQNTCVCIISVLMTSLPHQQHLVCAQCCLCRMFLRHRITCDDLSHTAKHAR